MEKIKTILLFGSPGSGKGTQGKLLGILPGFHHLACGNVFRSIDLSSEVGKVFLQYSSKGELVPDDFTVRLWREHIDKLIHTGALNPVTSVLVLDGIPRNIHQAKMLDQYIEVVKLICLRAVHNRDEMIRRLKSRALKENRLDDANDQTIRHRLDIYDKESRPVLAHYPKEISVDVNALQTPIEVAHDILSAILGRFQEMREVPPPSSAVAARN
ncbi:MAG TPA: nucleoside monophosphate kinase [Verrucomicrobiae bacterium]|nr:nucleoside monophosphate kinase [Verrucomicrobiae bacterium]